MSTLTFAPTVEPGAGLEPELALQTPREIPAELWTGSYARQAKKNISKLVKGGIIAIAMGGMSFVEDLASFFPLIEYSSWLGVGLLGVGAVLAVDLWVIRRRFRYVTDGVPTRVRIDDLALAPHTQSHGQPTSHRFHVWYSWRDPSNDETITCEDQSDVIKEEDRVKVTTSFRIGDEVTALHFKSIYAAALGESKLGHDGPKCGPNLGFGAQFVFNAKVGKTLTVTPAQSGRPAPERRVHNPSVT